MASAAADDAGKGRISAVRRRMRRPATATLVTAAALIAVDQSTKQWALDALADGRARPVWWTLQWNLVFNQGMAFSQGGSLGPLIGVVAVVIAGAVLVWSAGLRTRWARVAAGLLAGGALGNVIDRLVRDEGWMRGAVVDFIDVQWWPVFNVADIAVNVGAILLAILLWFGVDGAATPRPDVPPETRDGAQPDGRDGAGG